MVAQAQGWESPAGTVLLVSDDERERVVALLRQHWLAGRISLEQLEGRMTEAWAAADDRALFGSLRGLPVMVGAPVPPPHAPPRAGNATAALVCGIVGLTLLLISFGMLSFISLPLSATAWGLGRSSRRAAQAAGLHDGGATAGEALGIIGTVLGMLVIGGCAALVVSF
ncbi:MAG: DUF1707 SHOCT-like domain-containing protein [Thermoleophilaceae bacterium]